MAAHVFNSDEPPAGSPPDSADRFPGSQGPAAAADGPMFAAQPAVFHKMHQRSRVGAGPIIGLIIGALLIGGLIFAMSRHNQGANGATNGVHTTSQAPPGASAAATPVPAPKTGQPNPGPVANTPVAKVPAPAAPAPRRTAHATPQAAPTPKHLRIAAAPPARSAARAPARPARARPSTSSRSAATAASPDTDTATTPAAPAAPTPQQSAPAPAATPAPVTPPVLSTPAPQPTPAPAPATPAPATPDNGASGSATPQ